MYKRDEKLKNETLLFQPVIPEAGALKTVLAFPNTYPIGITSLGYQVIWATLAQRKDVDVRRLFTDRSEKNHKRCDLFGLSLSWELDGPILLDLLEQEKIPIWSNQRGEKDPIVFAGGPVLSANPEPFAPFLDVVLLGDGEELIPNFIDNLKSLRGMDREKKLIHLATVPGIYIPKFYKPEYSEDGELKSISATHPNIPKSISKQTFKGNSLSHSAVITPEAAWPNIHMIEVVRSCPELCRFCLASYLNLPFRTASLEDGLIPAVEKGLTATERIGLLGASVTQHPQFVDLLEWINQSRFDNVRLSVSSIRATTVTKQITEVLSKHGCKSLTLAIESGSERIRSIINKKLSEEEIFAAAKYAQEGGLKGLKLYGMVGLPTEEEKDIELTANLLLKLKEQTRGLRLKLGVSTFVPKAHTPFQWNGVRKEAKDRLKVLNKFLKPKGIDVRQESYGWSIIQTLISRGDRRLAPVIATIRQSNNTLGNWKKIYKEIRESKISNANDKSNELPVLPTWDEAIHDDWSLTKVLPWAHINGPLSIDKLIEHKKSSY